MGLLVALGDDGKARGELFWDDGESIGEFAPLTGYVFVVVIADKSWRKQELGGLASQRDSWAAL